MHTPSRSDRLARLVVDLDELKRNADWTKIVEAIEIARAALDDSTPAAMLAELSIRRADAACQAAMLDVALAEHTLGYRSVRESGEEELRARWELNASGLAPVVRQQVAT